MEELALALALGLALGLVLLQSPCTALRLRLRYVPGLFRSPVEPLALRCALLASFQSLPGPLRAPYVPVAALPTLQGLSGEKRG